MLVETHYASLGRRFLALLLDALVLILPCAILGHIIPFIGGLVVFFFYAPILESSELQATLGKYWVGIKVVDVQGRRISFQSSLLRNLVKLCSSVILFLGYLVALFSAKRQTLHDLLADTVVVYGRETYPVADAWMDSVRSVFGVRVFKNSKDTLSQLERLQNLRERGAISDEEFLREKEKIFKQPLS